MAHLTRLVAFCLTIHFGYSQNQDFNCDLLRPDSFTGSPIPGQKPYTIIFPEPDFTVVGYTPGEEIAVTIRSTTLLPFRGMYVAAVSNRDDSYIGQFRFPDQDTGSIFDCVNGDVIGIEVIEGGQLLDEITVMWIASGNDLSADGFYFNATVFLDDETYWALTSESIPVDLTVDSCDSNPCGDGATCFRGEGASYFCLCLDGSTGLTCPEGDPCSPNPCVNNGVCSGVGSQFTCACNEGFSGPTCEEVDFCALEPCMNNGRCVPLGFFFDCECLGGYTGTMCETALAPPNPCDSAPCLNDGFCIAGEGSQFACICAQGFIGLTCDEVVISDPCASNPCRAGSTCLATESTFFCLCVSGFTGSTCQEVVNPCTTNPCSNGGVCSPGQDATFSCVCPAGFTGQLCDEAVIATPCASNPCNAESTCIDLESIFICICAEGFTGTTCQDVINPCGTNPCLNGGVCSPGEDTMFSCECPAGFTGLLCEAVMDTPCASDPCNAGSTCLDVGPIFICNCAEGFTGRTCQEVLPDPCSPNPCFNGGLCSPPMGQSGLVCTCGDGFTGPFCDVTPCDSSPCLNGGTCSLDGSMGFTCSCPIGYTGDQCGAVFDPCESGPCRNGATCIPGQVTQYFCMCPVGYEGTDCEIVINLCDSGPCLNGAICSPVGGTDFTCSCTEGYTGDRCESEINLCDSSPCSNGGICSPVGGTDFTCACAEGYTGDRCDSEINLCDSGPCLNGAVCLPRGRTDFTCFCADGYTGDRCDSEIDPCESVPCLNGASCLRDGSTDGFTCTCADGYTGNRCAAAIPPTEEPTVSPTDEVTETMQNESSTQPPPGPVCEDITTLIRNASVECGESLENCSVICNLGTVASVMGQEVFRCQDSPNGAAWSPRPIRDLCQVREEAKRAVRMSISLDTNLTSCPGADVVDAITEEFLINLYNSATTKYCSADCETIFPDPNLTQECPQDITGQRKKRQESNTQLIIYLDAEAEVNDTVLITVMDEVETGVQSATEIPTDGSYTVEVQPGGITISEVTYICDPGYSSQFSGSCVRCPAGTMEEEGECVLCQPGQYQPSSGMVDCRICDASKPNTQGGASTFEEECDESMNVNEPLTSTVIGIVIALGVLGIIAILLLIGGTCHAYLSRDSSDKVTYADDTDIIIGDPIDVGLENDFEQHRLESYPSSSRSGDEFSGGSQTGTSNSDVKGVYNDGMDGDEPDHIAGNDYSKDPSSETKVLVAIDDEEFGEEPSHDYDDPATLTTTWEQNSSL